LFPMSLLPRTLTAASPRSCHRKVVPQSDGCSVVEVLKKIHLLFSLPHERAETKLEEKKSLKAVLVSRQMAPVTITGTESIPHYVVILVSIVTAAMYPDRSFIRRRSYAWPAYVYHTICPWRPVCWWFSTGKSLSGSLRCCLTGIEPQLSF